MISSFFVVALLAFGFDLGNQPVRRTQRPGADVHHGADMHHGVDMHHGAEIHHGADVHHGTGAGSAPEERPKASPEAHEAPGLPARKPGQPAAVVQRAVPAVAETRPPPVGLSARAALDALLPGKEEDDFKSSLLCGVGFSVLFGVFLYVTKPKFYTLEFFTTWSFPFWGFVVACALFYAVTEFLVDRVFPDGSHRQKAYRYLLGYVMYGCGAFVFHIVDGILGSRFHEDQKAGQKSELIKSGQQQRADLKVQKLRMNIFWCLSALSAGVPSFMIVIVLIGLAHAAKEMERARAPYATLESS